MLTLMMFAFTVNMAQTLTQLALITSIAAVTVPAAWWVVRKIQNTVRLQIAEQNVHNDASVKLESFEDTLSQLNEALLAHMSSEDITNQRIEQLGRDLVRRLESLESGLKGNQIHMMKALAASDSVPTLLWEVTTGGYKLLWANRAYLAMVGLTLAEAIGGGVWLAVSDTEREVVQAGAEAQAQAREDYYGGYTLVNPKTQVPIGKVDAEGHYITGSDDNIWFYLTTIIKK